MYGYTKPLYILAFDHRAFFAKNLFKKTSGLSEEETATIKEMKMMIYRGFLSALDADVPKDGAAVLVDEEYGADIQKDARTRGIVNILTTEKSGQELYDFEYGEDFGMHIESFDPVFAKALVRYRADGDAAANRIQLERLKRLSDWCHSHDRKFLVEPLVTPTEKEKAEIGQEKFDRDIRPGLTVDMIRQFQEAAVEPDIWKIEGMEEAAHYEAAVVQARKDGRDDVSLVVLGRAEETEHVEHWLREGRGVKGVVGFAIGRTIFWEPLQAYLRKEITKEQAVAAIATNYLHFYEVFAKG